jgi:hypothetical protein
MVGMDKISSSETRPKTSMTSYTRNCFLSFKKMLYLHLINDVVMEITQVIGSNDVVMEDNTSKILIKWFIFEIFIQCL